MSSTGPKPKPGHGPAGPRPEGRSPAGRAVPDAYLPDLAKSLTNLSNRLAEGGRETEALAPIEEAVQNNRRLGQANPDAYMPDLAGALSNLAIRLAAVGRRKQALAPSRRRWPSAGGWPKRIRTPFDRCWLDRC